mmetsp:Transcript_49389/g.123859  ORF Transcript_49389/g.123859 Transcript_49389/m.123859 type:complete len:306 (-) Transcript_49389:490-1407(-)
MGQLVANHRTQRAIVHSPEGADFVSPGCVAVFVADVEERRLQNGGGEDDLVEVGRVVGVDVDGRHPPQRTVLGPVQLRVAEPMRLFVEVGGSAEKAFEFGRLWVAVESREVEVLVLAEQPVGVAHLGRDLALLVQSLLFGVFVHPLYLRQVLAEGLADAAHYLQRERLPQGIEVVPDEVATQYPSDGVCCGGQASAPSRGRVGARQDLPKRVELLPPLSRQRAAIRAQSACEEVVVQGGPLASVAEVLMEEGVKFGEMGAALDEHLGVGRKGLGELLVAQGEVILVRKHLVIRIPIEDGHPLLYC